MAAVEAKVQKIFITDHPNADRLQIGNIGSPDGWQVVVQKGLYKTGDLCIYIGENALIPDEVLKAYGYWDHEKNVGILAGKAGNRVKGKRLREVFSLGITIPLKHINGKWFLETEEDPVYGIMSVVVTEGEDFAGLMGITKYEPPIPAQLCGEVYNLGTHVGVDYDIDDIRKNPHMFEENEPVQMTVKLHGTFCQIVMMKNKPEYYHEDNMVITGTDESVYCAIGSKGLSAQGLFFKDNEANAKNVYLRAAKPHLEDIAKVVPSFNCDVVVVCGEVYGPGIQDGFDYGEQSVQFRVFDVYIGRRGSGYYLNDWDVDMFCDMSNIKRVPIAYRGPFLMEKLKQLANAPEDAFNCKHVREGVVVKPSKERRIPNVGRVVAKLRSDAYMARKGGTEYN